MEVNYSSALNEETEKTKSVVAQEATRTAQLPNPVLLALDGGGIRGLAMVRVSTSCMDTQRATATVPVKLIQNSYLNFCDALVRAESLCIYNER